MAGNYGTAPSRNPTLTAICVIDGAQHEIYNVAHVTTKDGFKETELTLKTPAYDREVYDDETGTQ